MNENKIFHVPGSVLSNVVSLFELNRVVELNVVSLNWVVVIGSVLGKVVLDSSVVVIGSVVSGMIVWNTRTYA